MYKFVEVSNALKSLSLSGTLMIFLSHCEYIKGITELAGTISVFVSNTCQKYKPHHSPDKDILKG